ncbi:MAG: FHA domain-containing protein [Alphaproteobacteria bacterium]|nr:FHA domain-containing protein [Alphaproteobacteria bacterium]
MEAAGVGALIAGKLFSVIVPLIFLCLTTWMAWKIMVKAGFPGYFGLFNITGIIPGIGWIVWIILLWVFAFIQWPRDAANAPRVAYQPPGSLPPHGLPPLPPGPVAPQALPSPPQQLPAPAASGWILSGVLPGGAPLHFAFDESRPTLTVGAPAAPADLTIIDASVGAPHARLHVLPGRLGLEDLGTPGGTWIDGAQLRPSDGTREITNSRELRFGSVALSLARA